MFTTFTDSTSTTDETRFTVGLFLYGGLVAQAALLLAFSFSRGNGAAVALPVLLMGAIAGGYYGSRLALFEPFTGLSRIFRGFLLHAAGLLVLLLACHGDFSPFALATGVILSGVGQGIVFTAIKRTRGAAALFPRYGTVLTLLGAGLLTACCLKVGAQFTGTTGVGYAFALLLDLALLGAVYAKITAREREAA